MGGYMGEHYNRDGGKVDGGRAEQKDHQPTSPLSRPHAPRFPNHNKPNKRLNPNPNRNTPTESIDSAGNTPLHYAAEHNSPDLAKAVIALRPSFLVTRNFAGELPIHKVWPGAWGLGPGPAGGVEEAVSVIVCCLPLDRSIHAPHVHLFIYIHRHTPPIYPPTYPPTC